MEHKWYSNGKLMLTGEYAVLSGAVALALPVKYGQSLEVLECDDNDGLHFITQLSGLEWFNCKFKIPSLELISTSNNEKALYVQKLLRAANNLNSNFLSENSSKKVITNINFNPHWGMGSSSSLISNIAWWAGIDPFLLNREVSKGSGYDVACARAVGPVLYQITEQKVSIQNTSLNEQLRKNIFFVYLNAKQQTDVELERFFISKQPAASDIYAISDLSYAFVKTTKIEDIRQVVDIHEDIVSAFLKVPPLKKVYFSDFDGSVKSLGAWGGDFCMAVTHHNEEYVNDYFAAKGFSTIFNYEHIALKHDKNNVALPFEHSPY